jgi:hypothetical protein
MFFMAEISVRSSSLILSFHHEMFPQQRSASVPWGTTSTASSAVRFGSSKSTVSSSKFEARPSKNRGHA